jgi:Domain of unknown function (DU1801)
MAQIKTGRNDGDVDAFLDSVEDETRRRDARELRRILSDVMGEPGAMWGPSIVGFGSHHYRYASGREVDWFKVGFSPRKQSLTIYLVPGVERYQALLERLGDHKTGKGCVYVKRLSDVDAAVLRELVVASVRDAGAIGAP